MSRVVAAHTGGMVSSAADNGGGDESAGEDGGDGMNTGAGFL